MSSHVSQEASDAARREAGAPYSLRPRGVPAAPPQPASTSRSARLKMEHRIKLGIYDKDGEEAINTLKEMPLEKRNKALDRAVMNQDAELAEFLLKADANPNITKKGKPVIFTTVTYQFKKVFKLLLTSGADPANPWIEEKEDAQTTRTLRACSKSF